MNSVEQETIRLCIAVEALDDIANHELLDINDIRSVPGEAEVRFKSRVHQQMFLARLLDFSKEAGAKSITGVNGSCLDALRAACETKSFDVCGSVASLAHAIATLSDWLDAKALLGLWLPTLQIDAKLTLARSQLVFILGNHVKHNLSRLTGISRNLADVFTEHGYAVEPEQIPLALDDIREHLEGNYFIYYGTWLAELINNVRWGLRDYLLPELYGSVTRVARNPTRYECRYPPGITSETAKQWYWRLMWHVKSRPPMKRFVGAHYLKRSSSLE